MLIPRYLRFGVRERLDYHGEVVTPLNEDDVKAAVEKAKKHGVEIPVIGFLHSYINPAHEEQAAEIVKADYPQRGRLLAHPAALDRIRPDQHRGHGRLREAQVHPFRAELGGAAEG